MVTKIGSPRNMPPISIQEEPELLDLVRSCASFAALLPGRLLPLFPGRG